MRDPLRAERAAANVDAAGLERRLLADLEGEVRFDRASKSLYAVDGSNYRQVPIGVVVPRSTADIEATVAACREFGAPVLGRGAGTSLAGQCCNVAVVIDTSKYLHHVLEIDPERRLARVEPGTILDDLREQAARFDLTFGPDPATHNHCTLGGMIGNNSCGVHSILAGRTADNVEELDVLLYDGTRMRVGATPEDELARIIAGGGRRGEIYGRLRDLRDRYADLIRARYPDIPRRVSGYNLDELLPERGFNVARALVGSEGTLATWLEATLNLVPWPPARVLLVLGYPDAYSAGDHIPQVMEQGPIGCEGVDAKLIDFERQKKMNVQGRQMLPEGGGFLLVEFGGEEHAEAMAKAEKAMAVLKRSKTPPHMKLFPDKEEQEHVWQIRESGLGATARVPHEPDAWPGWEDAAVPPESVGEYLREFRALMDRYDYDAALYGHFGQGCIHCRITFDLRSADGLVKYRGFVGEAADLVSRYGGSYSGEHGDGQSRAELLPKMYGEELVQSFREFKSIWDPDWRMNPGKVVDPYPILSNLRLGTDYDPWQPRTEFQYPEDEFSFSRATLRCVGVGKCRRSGGGTMCPSYMVTREEMHSTRGRAHLLHDMLIGDVITDGWASEEVKEALDLCLACKGCKSDCPVNVDMATYKAEFLSHYYRHHPRPVAAYTMGLIFWWARLASLAPGLVNLVTHAPGLSQMIKRLGGIAPEREMPLFAPKTFKQWYRGHGRFQRPGKTVILWPDTFNNHFHPETGVAALEVLYAAGFRVFVPAKDMCCGRPLYDYGFLDLARHLLQDVIDTLRPLIRAGVPMVGLEPSCLAVFRDEMPALFPHDPDAQRLTKQTFTLGELLAEHAPDFQPPRLERPALVHGHCHHKAVMGLDGEEKVLSAMGLDVRTPSSTCCGMAGSFGFEEDKYDVSVAVGEHDLLPQVRRAAASDLIVTDGFSCRTQIEQHTERRALHLAQVLQMALRSGPQGPAGRPEDAPYLLFDPDRGLREG